MGDNGAVPRKGNANLPKCATCMNFGCNAGHVNHSAISGNPDRGACLMGCGCEEFVMKYNTLKNSDSLVGGVTR
jgi:hypothetical protein